MSSDRQHLLAGIRANVDDVAPYLIYADWLDEFGDHDDQQTAHCLRCAFDRARHFPTYDNLYVPEVDYLLMTADRDESYPLIPRATQSRPKTVLLTPNDYELWLAWREKWLFERRVFKLSDGIRVMPFWSRTPSPCFCPLPVIAHGSLRGLMQSAAALMRYYPFTDWTVYDVAPRESVGQVKYCFRFHTFALERHQAGQHYLPRELRPANLNGDSAYFESNKEARQWLSDALIAYGLRELERLS